MNAVIYARYSSDKQNDQSIEDQVRACEQYAKRKNLTIIKTYADRAKSGKTDKRPGFQQMIHDSAKKQFKAVLCWKFDRIGRNAGDYFINERILQENGAGIISVTEDIPEGPIAPILKGVYVGQAESYNIGLAMNVLRGMESNARACKSTGARAPVGYYIDKNKNYQIDTETAPYIREMFKRFINGDSYTELANYLADHGIHTAFGNTFTGNGIKKMLTNQKYIGTYKFKDIIIENGIPAIIEKETFMKVKKQINNYARLYTNRAQSVKYLLLGKVYCGQCGELMTAHAGTSKTGKMYRYYSCKNYKTGKGCGAKPYRKDLVEETALNLTKNYVLQNDSTIETIADYAVMAQEEFKKRSRLPTLQQELKENEKQIQNIMKLLMDGWASDELKTKLADLEQQKKELHTAIDMELIDNPEIDRNALVWSLKQFKNIEIKDQKMVRLMFQSLINSIVLDGNKITIVYNYAEKNKNTQTFDFAMLECSPILTMVDLPNCHLNFYKTYYIVEAFLQPAA